MLLFMLSTMNRALVSFSSFYGVYIFYVSWFSNRVLWIFPLSVLWLKLSRVAVTNGEFWRLIQSELWVVSALTPKLSSEYAKKCLRWLTSSNTLAGKSSILVRTLIEIHHANIPLRCSVALSYLESVTIINYSQCCSSAFMLQSGGRWGTRPTWKGAECYRRARVATSLLSLAQNSLRRRPGWDTILMNCLSELWCRWGKIGLKLNMPSRRNMKT